MSWLLVILGYMYLLELWFSQGIYPVVGFLVDVVDLVLVLMKCFRALLYQIFESQSVIHSYKYVSV